MKRLLLTGFEPFGGAPVNPSWEVARRLDGEVIGGAHVTALQLPCVFGRANEVLLAMAQTGTWDVVLSLGLAGNRSEVSVERIAINVDDARIPDNAGAQPVDVPVVPGGPAAYFGSLPLKRSVSALRGAGLPAAVSQTAGTYVCNHVFYGLMHWAASVAAPPRCGFVHLPPLAVLPLEAQVQAVRLLLDMALTAGDDIAVPGGAIA